MTRYVSKLIIFRVWSLELGQFKTNKPFVQANLYPPLKIADQCLEESLMNFAQSRTHAIPYFISSNIMPISMVYLKLSSVLMLDVSNNSASPSISDMFIPTGQVHKYNTRSSWAGNFYRKYSRLNHHKNSFASVGANIWNSIPENLRKLPKHTFKIEIKNFLFFNLEKQDSYADVDTLIGEIG